MRNILSTAFWTSFLSYLVFALAEYLRPGFVSYNFSLHYLLLLSIVFGILWASLYKDYDQSGFLLILSFFAKILLSIVLFVILWKEGSVFGDMRIFLALVAAAVPWMLSFESEKNSEYENEY